MHILYARVMIKSEYLGVWVSQVEMKQAEETKLTETVASDRQEVTAGRKHLLVVQMEMEALLMGVSCTINTCTLTCFYTGVYQYRYLLPHSLHAASFSPE